MSCSLDKTKELAIKHNVVNKYGTELPNKSSEAVNLFNQFKSWLVSKATTKYGDIVESWGQPMSLRDGVKVEYNPVFFNSVDISEKSKSIAGVNESNLDEIETEETLRPILDNLKSRFNVDYEFVNDVSLDWAGEYDYKSEKVKINLAKASLDTPFHEFAHPFIRIIRNTNRPLYNKFARELDNTAEGKGVMKQVLKDYPGLSPTDQIEEAIVTVIGLHAKGQIKNKSLIARVKEILNDILVTLGIKSINPDELPLMTMREFAGIMISDLNVDVSKAKEFDKGKVSKSVKDEKEKVHEKHYVFFTRRMRSLERRLESMDETSKRYQDLNNEYLSIKDKLSKLEEESEKEIYIELGDSVIDRAEDFISQLESGNKDVSIDNIIFTINTLDTFTGNEFESFGDSEKRCKELLKRLYPFLTKEALKEINKYSTEDFEITKELLDKQDTDIGVFTKSVGALSDLANYIGRTIGSIIKAAQNKASSNNKKLRDLVQSEVNKLEDWAKSNGMSLEDAYEMLIQEYDNEITLVMKYLKGKENPKWAALNDPANQPLLDFYNFYQKVLTEAERGLPYKIDKSSIPNIAKDDLVYKLKNLVKTDSKMIGEFVSSEDLVMDTVPDMYRAKIAKDIKSRDLGSSLLQFGAYANMHNELSLALPKVRLLQYQLKYKSIGESIKDRELISHSDSSKKILASKSNLMDMIDSVIDMQLKGQMSKRTFKPRTTSEIKNSDGEIIGYKQVDIDGLVDLGLKYNSLLRIGLSPVTAVANVLFGDVSNIIESIGGRFFSLKNLSQATNIFFNQIDYTSDEKKGDIYKWLEVLNPLQELDDYDLGDDIKMKKMNAEKLHEYMYSMQKKGELFLQSRTMIAMLIKEGYMTAEGVTTEKGNVLLLSEDKSRQMSDKVQRLNQMIHGRYSSREAATLQQSVIYRAMIQFRKWIPSAIEARLGEKQYDNRLGVEIEGRYRTLSRLVLSKDVFQNLIKMSNGELSELEMYNMKKNLTELALLAASVLGYMALIGGDDEEAKKRRKNPAVKIMLTLTDRIAGDLEFFYSPKEVTNLAKNSIPLAKTIQDLIKVIENLPASVYLGDWQYKKGSMKGSNKFYVSLNKILIGARPIQEVQKLLNSNPLDEWK